MASSVAALWHEETRPEHDGMQLTRCCHALKATKSHLAAVQLVLERPEFEDWCLK